jgi:hypothetical protein
MMGSIGTTTVGFKMTELPANRSRGSWDDQAVTDTRTLITSTPRWLPDGSPPE